MGRIRPSDQVLASAATLHQSVSYLCALSNKHATILEVSLRTKIYCYEYGTEDSVYLSWESWTKSCEFTGTREMHSYHIGKPSISSDVINHTPLFFVFA